MVRRAHRRARRAGRGARRGGRRRLPAVLITGDAGIGKSRLVTEVARRAAAVDAEVLIGNCLDLAEGGAPYAAVNEVLAAIGAPRPAGRIGRRPVRPAARRPRAADGRLAPCVLVARGRPLVRPLDAGPAHPPLRRSGRAPPAPAGDVSQRRLPAPRSPAARTLAELERSERVERLQLEGFGPADLLSQLEGILDGRPDEATGVPSSSGPTASPCSPRSSPRRSPGTASCPSASTSCCCPGSTDSARRPRTCCEPLPSAAGASATGCSPRSAPTTRPALAATLREAVSHHLLVVDGDGYRFRHALLHEAIAGDVLPGERERIHAAFAATIERRPELAAGDHRSALVHHWAERPPPGPSAARRRRGRRSRRVGVRHCRRRSATGRSPSPRGRRPSARSTPTSCRSPARSCCTGPPTTPAAPVTSYAPPSWSSRPSASVDPAAEPSRAALLHERRGWCLLQAGRASEAMAAYEHAVELVPQQPPTVARARVLAAYADALERAGDDRAERTAERAVDAAVAAGSPADEGHARHTLGACPAGAGAIGRPAWTSWTGRSSSPSRVVTSPTPSVSTATCGGELVSAGRAGELVERARGGAARAARQGHARPRRRARRAGGRVLPPARPVGRRRRPARRHRADRADRHRPLARRRPPRRRPRTPRRRRRRPRDGARPDPWAARRAHRRTAPSRPRRAGAVAGPPHRCSGVRRRRSGTDHRRRARRMALARRVAGHGHR